MNNKDQVESGLGWPDIEVTGDVLARTAARLPGKTALICHDEQLSYREMDAGANRAANALLALGLKKGAKVAIMARNVPAYALIYYGAARSGHVLVHTSTRYIADELAYVLNKSDSEALIVEAPFADIAQAAILKCPAVKHLIVIDDITGECKTPPDLTTFPDLVDQAPDSSPDVEIAGSDMFGITFTGGTTGFPKGAAVDHRARLISSFVGADEQNVLETDIAAITTPLFHTAGLFVWYQPVVLRGGTAVLIPKWSAAAFLEAVRTHHITAAFLVPTQIVMLLNDPAFDEQVFARLKKIAYGGSAMPPALLAELIERFPDLELANNYGQTESCPLSMFRADLAPDRVATLGKAPRGIDVAILSPEGHVLPPGEVGEIASRGAHNMLGYYNDPEQTEAWFKGGWGCTGDLGVMDEDGYISLVDRSKDMVISGGENIYPREIENVLHEHPAVAECAVFGVPDDTWGEVIAAHICLRHGHQAGDAELLAFCQTNLARFKLPKIIKIVDDLPKTAIGKIQKNVLKDLYRD
jgi:acyl-CoA synthetase (AMP-forming)/AMP-acid ligase II